MRHILNAALLLGVALLSAYFMAEAYARARGDAIAQLYAQERILANQAAKGVIEYFSYHEQTLTFLGRDPEIIGCTERGRRQLRELFASQAGTVLSVTRVDSGGHILYTYPDEKSIGRDISAQSHVRAAFTTRKPVVSEVFMSVQGFETVALHVPVFDNGSFSGTLAVLIPFSDVLRKHLDGIRIGASGNATLLSRDGTELYCSVPDHIGRSIFSTGASYPGVLALARRALAGGSGTTDYDDSADGQPGGAVLHKHAYFMPIPLQSTAWSIIVTAPESEALVFIEGFRNRWIVGVSLLLVSFGVWGVFLGRAYLTIQRQRAQQAARESILAAERRADEERERLETQLRQAQKLEAIGQLAGGVAHDFNNLLTVQLGHLSLLQETRELPADVRESIAEVEKSATMAARLTRQLLAFSRRQVLQIARLDLNTVLDNILSMLRRVLREDISLELRMSRDPLWVDADAGMMEQVVMNLVVNARDAMPRGGRLTLVTEAVDVPPGAQPAHEVPAGRYVRLTVSDTGNGMDQETLQRVFEPFFTTKESGRGTGLGLATVYGIVRQHKGWIDVDSTPGAGTTFRIHYPAAAPPDDAGRPGSDGVRPPTFRGLGETILLAEDEPSVRHAVAASLESLNYRVVTAGNGVEAIRAWEEHQGVIDLLLTDMVMPDGLNGLQLIGKLRARHPGLKAIIMSGHSQDLAADGLAPDIAFVPKPCTAATLARPLRQALQGGRTRG